jgi:hypothetical protein
LLDGTEETEQMMTTVLAKLGSPVLDTLSNSLCID